MVSQLMSVMMVNYSKWFLDQGYPNPSGRFWEPWTFARGRLCSISFLAHSHHQEDFWFSYINRSIPFQSLNYETYFGHAKLRIFSFCFCRKCIFYLNLCKFIASQRSLNNKDLPPPQLPTWFLFFFLFFSTHVPHPPPIHEICTT